MRSERLLATNDRALDFLIPGDLQVATGGYIYDRRMVEELRALGWQVTLHTLDASFPDPSSTALEHADRVLAGIPSQTLVLIDGLALSAMPQVLCAHAVRLKLVALIHMPLAAEPGADGKRAQRLQNSENQALQSVRHVIVTGRTTAAMLRGYGAAAEKISVIEPGTDERPLASRPRNGILKMICVATVCYGKGHDLLIDALAPLASWPWQLCCVGSLTRSPTTVMQLRAQLHRHGLTDRVALIGEVRAAVMSTHFLNADLFVLATRFESYCMAAAEALAHGLPVVSTHTGAIPDLVGTQAGLLVPPNDVDALRAALTRVLREPALLAELSSAAVARRALLPRWSQAAARMSLLLTQLDERTQA